MNEGGVSIRAVTEYLGRYDPGFTLRTYAHLMPDDEDRVLRLTRHTLRRRA